MPILHAISIMLNKAWRWPAGQLTPCALVSFRIFIRWKSVQFQQMNRFKYHSVFFFVKIKNVFIVQIKTLPWIHWSLNGIMKSSFSRISSRTSNFSTIMQLSRAKSRFAKVPINIGKSPTGRRLSVLDLARRERAAKVRYSGHFYYLLSEAGIDGPRNPLIFVCRSLV